MNDPSRIIDVEKASLLSLKAELLRKKEEAKTSVPIQTPIVKKDSHKLKSKTIPKTSTSKETNSKTIEYDDSIQNDAIRRKLEAKAKYYDKMMKSSGSLNSDDNSLILFNKKAQQNRDQNDSDSEDESGMVDYIDVFGRTRRVAKDEIAKIKNQDQNLVDVVREDQANPNKNIKENSSENSESESEDDEGMIGPDVGLQFRLQKEKWHEQEQININRDNLHYQDILYDEAREHGVGYYEFSTDIEERAKQQEELRKIHIETKKEQEQRDKIKQQRDAILANRIKMAKNRLRTRLGLPEQEEELNKPDEQDKTTENEDKHKAELLKKKERDERRREDARKRHIRPWDKSKIGVVKTSESSENDEQDEWKPQKEFRVLTQDEWIDRKRDERNAEFAPFQDNNSKRKSTNYNDFEEESKGLYFSSKKLKRRNLSLEANSSNLEIPSSSTSKIEIPQIPINSKTIEESVTAGLKFVRDRIEKGKKTSFTANKEYQM